MLMNIGPTVSVSNSKKKSIHPIDPPQPQSTMSPSSSSSQQDQIKQSFIKTLGQETWASNPSWSSITALDPAIMPSIITLLSLPKRNHHLTPKFQSLVSLAIDASATHLYVPGISQHIRAAKSLGATQTEIFEVLELTSTLGIHACNVGIPVLVEVLKEEGRYVGKKDGEDERRAELKTLFTQKRGYWHAFWEEILCLDPQLFEAYTAFSSVPWERGEGGLSAMEKELIYCAFDAAATHLYVSGLKEHMRNALRYGASVEQIVEVLELAMPLSFHTLNVAAPIVGEVFGTN
ncbi:hypothetical protein AC578_645 [Pseudocercospora eumusae]|uniref:Carboxymuconolactone decarboxylase-like domain-containing protein n=1 Tax=Pseudocercospora eumusae TaxID=321146 RepID=A0A139HKP8_9PEZI|nr:hypothetical protein AC578_645 [Pseudocercospora eumusae]KXT02993.1 hypothetical protein AC578_645 [Pseudocercospora eumusae]